MLESRDLLEQGNNAIKATLHILLVRTKAFVRNLIGEGVLTRIERQGGTTEVERHRARWCLIPSHPSRLLGRRTALVAASANTASPKGTLHHNRSFTSRRQSTAAFEGGTAS